MGYYACTDLHGQYELWFQIKAYLKPDDVLYFLGDAIDRGKDGFKIMQEILARPNTTYIRGNHEDMMYNMLEENLKANWNIRFSESATELWFYNGAKPTWESIQNSSQEDYAKIMKQIEDMPILVKVTLNNRDLYLCHSGSNMSTIRTFIGKETLQTTTTMKYHRNLLIWDRKHINNKKWGGEDNEYIIHGHTPVNYMFDAHNKGEHIEKYCQNHKICLDLGAHIWGRACLFNLETLEVEKYFSEKEVA